MGRGTWYYSLGVFLEIVDVFVRSGFEISSWRGARVDVRTYLLGGAIDSSEANGIIRDPKLELESSRFTFDLVPLSYESVDVVVGENWLLRHKAEMNRISYGISTRSDADLRRLVSFDVFRKARGRIVVLERLLELHGGEVGGRGVRGQGVVVVMMGEHESAVVASFVVLVPIERKRRVREAFSNNVKRHQRGKLSRCRWNHMGNEPILALRKDAVRFVVYYDSAKQEFGACWEKEEREEEEKGDCLPSTIWERQNIVVVPWNRIKEVKPRMSSSRFTTIDSSFENKDVGGIKTLMLWTERVMSNVSMIALMKVVGFEAWSLELTRVRNARDQMRSWVLKRNGICYGCKLLEFQRCNFEIIHEVFVKLLLDSFGKLSISRDEAPWCVLFVAFVVRGFQTSIFLVHQSLHSEPLINLPCPIHQSGTLGLPTWLSLCEVGLGVLAGCGGGVEGDSDGGEVG
ncbi:hypothetical protein Tco_0152103 [Tanacetum coccineum]